MIYLHSPAEMIRSALITLNQGILPENLPTIKTTWNSLWPINVGTENEDPDNQITIFDRSGRIQGRIQITGDMCIKPMIQVRVRSNPYNLGYVKIAAIRKALDTQIRNTNVSLDSAVYMIHAVTATSIPIGDGYERPFAQQPQTKRRVFSFNAIMTISRIS